jgi:glycosyltransferase involved in cell wall biosynthesis
VKVSVVVPVYNPGAYLEDCVASLLRQSLPTGEYEAIFVDDGSTDGSGARLDRLATEHPELVRVIHIENSGWPGRPRNVGLDTARGDYVLFVDGRVRLAPTALAFVRERVEERPVWNGHVHVEAGSAFGVFWRLLAELAWRDYFDRPRTTSFGFDDFDRYPKGTTCFLAPRPLLAEAFGRFHPRSLDARWANDDTPILRDVAARQRIWLSPMFACFYAPRTSLASFFRHAIRRGAVFVDGHGTPASRFFPVVVAFFPLSAALLVAALRRPIVAPLALAAPGAAAAAYAARAGRSDEEIRALALVTPVYALGHGIGMWRGLAEIVRARLGR